MIVKVFQSGHSSQEYNAIAPEFCSNGFVVFIARLVRKRNTIDQKEKIF
jgi:hypothetical protein